MKKTLFTCCVVLILLTACGSKATPTPFVGTGSAKIGDITMYFEGKGTGKPLILLSGVLTCTDFWSKQVDALAAQYNVIIPESRGMCRTTGMDTEISPHIMAEDTIKLMDSLGIDKAYVVGYLEGANTALDMAINHPDRLSAVVTTGAYMNPQVLDPGWIELLKNTPIKDIADFFASSEYLSKTTDPENIQKFVEKVVNMWLTEPNVTKEQLAALKVPLLILAGNYDGSMNHEHHREIADVVPNSELVFLPADTIDLVDQEPEQYNQAILDFLKDK